MIEKLSKKLTEAGIENEIINRGFLRQIRLKNGDVVEGLGINKIESSGFGHDIIEGLNVETAFRLITGTKNPEVAEDFDFNMPVGTYVSDDFIDKIVNELPPVSYRGGYVQMGEAYNHVENTKTNRIEPVYATFVRIAFDTWQWRGYCFKDEAGQPKAA